MYKILFLLCFSLLTPLSGVAQKRDSTFKDTIKLQEVVVTQKYIKHEAGKYIVNVVPLRKGRTDLIDLLGQIPGIIIADDKINIQGKGSVKVMFNGRLQKLPADEVYSILKSRPAYNVTKVEVIKDPGSKYDAEGNYGILNIVTGKKIDFIGGDAGEEISYQNKWTNKAHSSMNYSKGKIDATLNAGWTYGKIDYTESNTTHFSNLTRYGSTRYTPLQNEYNLSGMLDLHLDSLSTAGISVSYMNTYKKNNGLNNLNSYNQKDEMVSSGNSYSFTRTPRENLTTSFYIDRKWNSTDKISLMADWFRYNYHNDYDFRSNIIGSEGTETRDNFTNQGHSLLNGFNVALDLEKQLPWNVMLSVGGKLTQSTTKNTTVYDITTLPLQNDAFRYSEDIYAGYLSMDKKVENYEFIVGGRYEQTKTKSVSNDEISNNKSYGQFFPDVRVSYNFNDGSNIAFSLNSSIDRPSIRHINPFAYYVSRYDIAKGNPELRPSTWWNIRLSNSIEFNGGELISDMTYARLSNVIDQTTTLDEISNISITQWNNAIKQKILGLESILYYYKLKWLKITASAAFDLSKSSSDISYLTGSQRSFGQFYSANLRFILNKKQSWTGFLSSSYNGSEKNINGKTGGFFNMSCGINHSCFRNCLNMRFAVSNILASKFSGYTRANDGMYMSFKNDYHPLTFTFAVSYNFGKDISIRSKRHNNEDMESRFQ